MATLDTLDDGGTSMIKWLGLMPEKTVPAGSAISSVSSSMSIRPLQDAVNGDALCIILQPRCECVVKAARGPSHTYIVHVR